MLCLGIETPFKVSAPAMAATSFWQAAHLWLDALSSTTLRYAQERYDAAADATADVDSHLHNAAGHVWQSLSATLGDLARKCQ